MQVQFLLGERKAAKRVTACRRYSPLRDADGDAVFLCNDPVLVNTKIDKPIIIDIDDKVTTQKKKYDAESIVNYEMATRDSRIDACAGFPVMGAEKTW